MSAPPSSASSQPQPSSAPPYAPPYVRPSVSAAEQHDPHYRRPRPSFYPMPYPLSYPPSLPSTRPASQSWSHERPHRYVVCRWCDTILLCLGNLPTSVLITRHFTDDIPASMSQIFEAPDDRTKIHHADALMWLRRPFAGLFRYDASADTTQSTIPLACRACGRPCATLVVIFIVGDAASEENNQTSTSSKSCVRVMFKPWSISLSDAYGREISAAAEANGFWNHTPAPFAGRPLPER